MKIAFCANPTVGHTNFLISLAAHAIKKGDEVVFLLPGIKSKFIRNIFENPALTIDEKLEKVKIPHKLIPPSLYQVLLAGALEGKRGLEEVLFALKVFSAGARHYTGYLMNEFIRERPDALVYDFTFLPAIAVSESLGIPRIAVYHSGLPFMEHPIPPLGTTFKYGELSQEEFNHYKRLASEQEMRIKKRYERLIGMQIKTGLLLSPNSDFLNIVNAMRETEYPRKLLRDSVFFTGPSIQGHLQSAETPYLSKKNKKLIYISLGTFFNRQPELFTRIINSIGLKDAEILVAAGASYSSLSGKGFNSNVRIEKFVPQLNVLRDADVFITHGGKNSINEALTFAVPMILFPAGGEQEYNANLVEFINAGINFGRIKDSFTSEKMNSTLRYLMNDTAVRESLHKISAKHKKVDGAEAAYEIIRSRLGKM